MDITLLSQAGLTESELLAIRASAITSLTTDGGKVSTSISIPGLSATYAASTNPTELLAAVTYALQLLDPDTYGQPMITEYIGYTK